MNWNKFRVDCPQVRMARGRHRNVAKVSNKVEEEVSEALGEPKVVL